MQKPDYKNIAAMLSKIDSTDDPVSAAMAFTPNTRKPFSPFRAEHHDTQDNQRREKAHQGPKICA